MSSLKANASVTVESHFHGRDSVVYRIYVRLIKALERLGEVSQEPKKTSIHLVKKTAFAGVATRKGYLILTVKSDQPLKSARIHKTQQTSANRFHHELKINSPAQIDAQLVSWLENAYRLSC